MVLVVTFFHIFFSILVVFDPVIAMGDLVRDVEGKLDLFKLLSTSGFFSET